MSTSDVSNYNCSHSNEVEQPLQGEDRLKNAREEKTLNTINSGSYPRNIHMEEFEYTPSEDNSSTRQRSASEQHPRLYKFRHRTVWMAVAVALVISLLSISLSAYSVAKYGEAVTELKVARENRGKVCLPCKDQTLPLPSWKERNAAGDCCVELQEVLYMVNQIAEEKAYKEVQRVEAQLATKYSTSTIGNSSAVHRVSAHAVLSALPGEQVTWSTNDETGLSHITEGLRNKPNGRIKVSNPGYYFIYALLTISQSVSQMPAAFSYEVRVQDLEGGSSRTLMKNGNMIWKSREERTYTQQAGYIGGTFLLRAGATVYVHYENGDNLIESCGKSDCFFGLYKL